MRILPGRLNPRSEFERKGSATDPGSAEADPSVPPHAPRTTAEDSAQAISANFEVIGRSPFARWKLRRRNCYLAGRIAAPSPAVNRVLQQRTTGYKSMSTSPGPVHVADDAMAARRCPAMMKNDSCAMTGGVLARPRHRCVRGALSPRADRQVVLSVVATRGGRASEPKRSTIFEGGPRVRRIGWCGSISHGSRVRPDDANKCAHTLSQAGFF